MMRVRIRERNNNNNMSVRTGQAPSAAVWTRRSLHINGLYETTRAQYNSPRSLYILVVYSEPREKSLPFARFSFLFFFYVHSSRIEY